MSLFAKFCLAVMGLTFAVPCVHAQQSGVDLGVTYVAEHSLRAATSQNFWMQGGAIELGANLWHGWGAAVDVTGTHTNSVGSSGIPLSLVTATFGPRFRWHSQNKVSAYGEALVGEANGFRSNFPSQFGAQAAANSMALQLGGGVDYRLRSRWAVRLLDAAYVRTSLPNATDNVQNTLRVGAGVVVRFGR